MSNPKGFASDNNSGVHPEVMVKMMKVNTGHAIAYGDDEYTVSVKNNLKKIFGGNVEIYFVFTGTAANVLGLSAVSETFNSVICPESAHINKDECGAPEKIAGCKLLPVEAAGGKITIEGIKKHMFGFGFQHHSQPKIISITQATELGTLYSISEIKSICDFAHDNEMYVHMDGARICNAAAALNVSFKGLTADTGLDFLSFGGTKNGMMYGEAIVFFNKDLKDNFKYIRKQNMQLASKMRFIAAQFDSLFGGGLWKQNADQANRTAALLEEKLTDIPQVRITQKVETNGVFAIVPKEIIPKLQEEFFFYVWDEFTSEVRWMTSWDTTEEDVEQFVSCIKKLVSA